jgi:acetaldehyde dehydrogenase (acetylating)
VVKDWREGCERCIQILRYGGMGHTMSIHSKNEEVILQFGLKKPAFRICVNTPTTHGSIGLTTGLDPAMTLGCGGFGGNITSDNITPKHLLNIKRLAYEVRPATANRPDNQAGHMLPKAPGRPVASGIPVDALASRIDRFLTSRGYTKEGQGPRAQDPVTFYRPEIQEPGIQGAESSFGPPAPAEFVCEDDVRAALKAGRKLVVDEKTIITPAARDLGEPGKVFVQSGWPR